MFSIEKETAKPLISTYKKRYFSPFFVNKLLTFQTEAHFFLHLGGFRLDLIPKHCAVIASTHYVGDDGDSHDKHGV